MSPPKSSTFGGFEDRTAAGISGLRRLQSRRVRGAQAKRLSSPARCCGWEIGNQCEQVYELSDFAIKYLVIRLLIMICIVGCGMKPAGAIPHRPYLVQPGRGVREMVRVGGGESEDGLSPEPPGACASRRSWRVLRRRSLPGRNSVFGPRPSRSWTAHFAP